MEKKAGKFVAYSDKTKSACIDLGDGQDWFPVKENAQQYFKKVDKKSECDFGFDEGKLVYVKQNSKDQSSQPKSQYQRNMETRENKHVEMILSYAKDLVIADKSKTLDSAVEGLMIARQRIMDWKGESEGENPSE